MTTPTATIMIPYHALDDLIQRGTRAAQPDAADVVPGTLYAVTDEGSAIERSNGTMWQPYGATGSGGGSVGDADTLDGLDSTDFVRAPLTAADLPAHHTRHEPGGVDAMAVDAAAAIGSLRTLGTGATQAAPGNDARFGAPSVPTAHHVSHEPGGSDALAVDAAAAVGSLRTLGTGATQAAAGNDARFAAGTAAHHATHELGGSDVVQLDASQLTSGTVPVARLGAGTTTIVLANTDTGTIHNWAPGLAGNTLIEWTGASDLVLTGLAGGVAGQCVTIINTGAATLLCAHYQGSVTANRLFNQVRSGGHTALGDHGGTITYQYDGGVWVLVAHEQGAWITTPFAASDFTGAGGLVWTVDAGDVLDGSYRLSGKTLVVNLVLVTTTLSGTANPTLSVRLPGGYLAARYSYGPFVWSPDGTTYTPAGLANVGPSGTTLNFSPNIPTSNWPLVANTFSLFCQFACAVQ